MEKKCEWVKCKGTQEKGMVVWRAFGNGGWEFWYIFGAAYASHFIGLQSTRLWCRQQCGAFLCAMCVCDSHIQKFIIRERGCHHHHHHNSLSSSSLSIISLSLFFPLFSSTFQIINNLHNSTLYCKYLNACKHYIVPTHTHTQTTK